MKWDHTCASIRWIIIGKLNLFQHSIPLFWMFSNQALQHVTQTRVNYLSLNIRLWMISWTKVQLLPQCPPEVTCQPNIFVKDNTSRKTMQFYNFIKEQVRNMSGITCFKTGNKIFHFGKPINHYKDWIIAFLSSSQTQNEVHTYRVPRPSRNRKWCI